MSGRKIPCRRALELLRDGLWHNLFSYFCSSRHVDAYSETLRDYQGADGLPLVSTLIRSPFRGTAFLNYLCPLQVQISHIGCASRR
jgi:hypothetical protein